MNYIFQCKKCESIFEDRFYYLDGECYHSDTDKKIGQDPPESWPCPDCNSESTERLLFDPTRDPEDRMAAVHIKGITGKILRREEKLRNEGMDKELAHQFYKDSIQASKERMSTMGEVYKKVDCDFDTMVKTGQAKKISDKQKAEKLKVGKQVQQEIKKRKK